MKNILLLSLITVCLAAGSVAEAQEKGWRLANDGVLYVENDSAWANIEKYFAEPYEYRRTWVEQVVVEEYATDVPDGAFFDWGIDEVSLSQAKRLKRIGEKAFYRYSCRGKDGSMPKEFAFPDSLEYIGEYAFSRAGDLEFYMFEECHVTFPKSLKYIGARAFYGTGIASVTFPEGLEYIGDRAFWETRIDSVKFPDGLKRLYDAFCLSSAEIPEGLEDYYFSSISTVKFPQNDTWIPRGAFGGNKHLYRSEGQTDSTLVIPSGIRIIGQGAFYNCKALRHVVLPASVDTVENESFYGITHTDHTKLCDFRMDCYAIEPPGIRTHVPWFEDEYAQVGYVKGGNAVKADLYVPAESVEKYKASPWAYEFDIYALDPQDNPYTAIKDVEGNKLKVNVRGGVVSVEGVDKFDVYDISGRKMPTGRPLPAGVYVVATGAGSERVVVK